MKLSSRARYGLRMMLDVGRRGGTQHPVSLASISERTGLSRGYLEQVAAALRTARLIRATAGRTGGYRLTRPAGAITIGAIIEATIGPICLVDCLELPESCPRTEFCECRIVYALINHRIAEVLHGYTLADLLDPSWVRSLGAELEGVSGLLGTSPARHAAAGDGDGDGRGDDDHHEIA
ncbi:MAG: Rrf2 family transcriptional regulator [Candidatus Eiseniibacteriota bacterium]|jgi:Rrf2 family protein